MASVGGSIESVSADGRLFAVAGDADGARKLGGDENDVQPNGDGSSRLIKTKAPWQMDGLTLECDDSRDDQLFLQELANRNTFFPVAFTMASGEVYQGSGQITGENPMNNQSQTIAVSFMGTGQLTRQ